VWAKEQVFAKKGKKVDVSSSKGYNLPFYF
jgi:hypothetical protein